MVGVLSVSPAAFAAVVISSNPTSNMSCSSGVCTPTAANAVLNVGDLTSMLASGSVTVNTGSGSLPAQVEDINVATSFNWASANSLTLDAYRSVAVNAPIAVNGSAAVSLITNDGGSGGNLSFVSGGRLSFLGTSNSLTVNGISYTLVNDIATLSADITNGGGGGYYAFSANYNASLDGTYSSPPIANFDGVLQGLGNTISNLTVDINEKKHDPVSLSFFNKNLTKTNHPVGLVAFNTGIVANINISNSSITGGGNDSIGGIVGYNYGTLVGDHFSGKVSGGKGSAVGGLAGTNTGVSVGGAIVTASSSSAEIVGGTGSYDGGLVGTNNYTVLITSSYATGPVKASENSYVGGLVGWAYGGTYNLTVSNSYSTGNAKGGRTSIVGGFMGQLQIITITNSYSTGRPESSGVKDSGGFLGAIDQSATNSNDYWNVTTSKAKHGVGLGQSPGVTGLTTTQLQSGLPTGFDPTIWAENPSINNGFPYLLANPPQ
jgi:hypothetical protein